MDTAKSTVPGLAGSVGCAGSVAVLGVGVAVAEDVAVAVGVAPVEGIIDGYIGGCDGDTDDGTGVLLGDGVPVLVGATVFVLLGDGVLVLVGATVFVLLGDGVLVLVGATVCVLLGDGVLVLVGTTVFVLPVGVETGVLLGSDITVTLPLVNTGTTLCRLLSAKAPTESFTIS
jgi:hypothetical protein